MNNTTSCLVPSDYDVMVAFPDGSARKLNLFQMGLMAKAVRMRAETGVWPPSVNKLRLTKAQICEQFCIDPAWARTYSMLADTLEECHADLMSEFRAHLAAA